MEGYSLPAQSVDHWYVRMPCSHLDFCLLNEEMTTDKALVQMFSSYETMGSSTAICSDRIGIVTVNRMTIVEV